jgi:hypothetical protein
MDLTVIMAVIEKGLTLIPILIQAGQDVSEVVGKLTTLSQDAQTGGVTQAQLDELEADLDQQIADFNTEM